jgi:DNA-binding beta-propeller fold protein YncE
MLKKGFGLMVVCASWVSALFVLSSAPHFGLVWGAPRQEQQAAGAASTTTSSGTAKKIIYLTRGPVRKVEDTYSSFSAVAVDDARGEIVLEDENRNQIVTYGRLDNTPAQATMSEPKRIIGGSRTKIRQNCGLYVDPFSGDIYSVNADQVNYMTVWSRQASGNMAAERELLTPHRAFAVVVDEEAKELYMTIEHPPAVVVFRKDAKENDAPLRILEGGKTQLAEVHGIALDTKNQLLYVANQGPTASNTDDGGWSRDLQPGSPTVEWTVDTERWRYLVPGSGEFRPPSITAYPLKATGDTPPVRVIKGPLTRLDWPAHISLDVEHNELFVANSVTDEILVFRASEDGNVAPIRVLKGPHTGLGHPHGVFVDTKNDELIVANFGNHSSTVYRRTASGDTPPLRTIRAAPANAPAPMLDSVGAIAFDTKRDQILAPN